MLNNIRNFSKTIFAKILLVIIVIPFVFWGMGDVFNSGNTNSLVKINNSNISTQDFIEHINKSNINPDIVRQNIDNNVLEELLGKLISNKLLSLEINDLKLTITEKILAERIRKNKNFLDESENFSRTKYEKFLLSNNITAPEFEKRLKNNELQKDLFTYIGGGIKPPYFLTNKTYQDETKKIKINYINLEKIYKSKDSFSNKEINDFVDKNKDSLKKDYVDFSYSKITPNNLIGIEEYNNDFFKKLDEIENKISNNFNFDQLIHEYNLEKISKINFIPLNKDENIENKIYELRNDSSLRLIDQNDFFLLLKIDKINSITPKINDKDFAETVRQMLFQKNKYEYNKNLLKNINKKKFNDNDFEKLANNDKNKILNSTFNSIKDNSKFNIDSVKLIYSLPINSFVLIADDKENIYLAKILKENFTNLGKNNKIIDIYTAQTGSNIKNKMYSSYDNFMNSKYDIKINEKTLERVKNYFK